MDLGLTGRGAAIAGGSSGLGLAIARELAREGADAAICARDPDRLATAVRELRAIARGQVLGARVDLQHDDETRRWIDGTAARAGRLDIVVANTGGPPLGHPTAFDIAGYR